LKEYLNKYC